MVDKQVNEFMDLLERNDLLLTEIEKDCNLLPNSTSGSWFYLLPYKTTDIPVSYAEDISRINVCVELNVNDIKTNSDQENNLITIDVPESEQEMHFTSSQKNYSDLLTTDISLVEKFCNRMDIKTLKNDELVELCSFFEGIDENVPVKTGIFIFKESFYYKIKDLSSDNKMSCSLKSSIQSLTIKHAHFMFQGVLLPCLTEIRIDIHQAEILGIIMGSLPERFLKTAIDYISSSNMEGDSDIIMLEVIVNRNIKLGEDVQLKILNQIKLINDKNVNSVRLGRLLICMLKRYKDKVTNHEQEILFEIVNRHSSFMKKAALAKLNSLIK